MRAIYLFPVLSVFTVSLTTNVAYSGKDIRPNEFRRAGDSLVCITEKYTDSAPPYLQCLRIGPIFVGQSHADVSKLLGEPWKILQEDKSTILKVYPINTNHEKVPYWVVTFKSGIVDVIQLTGTHAGKDLTFSSIRLGDSMSKVTEILGNPAATKPVAEIGGELWSYRPFPISVEIKDKRVYSIRISRQ